MLRRKPSGLSWRVSRSWRKVRLVGVDILVGLDVRSRSAVAVIESKVGAEKEPIASKMACGGLWNWKSDWMYLQEKKRWIEVGYEVPIIWREWKPNLDSNLQMVENRFWRLLSYFRRQQFEKDYQAAVQKYLDQSHTSHVPDPVSARYFLAHQGVYKGKKLRVVYDDAAAFKGKCLNDAIISGPSLHSSLAPVITHFRWRSLGLGYCGHVQPFSAFYRIS